MLVALSGLRVNAHSVSRSLSKSECLHFENFHQMFLSFTGDLCVC